MAYRNSYNITQAILIFQEDRRAMLRVDAAATWLGLSPSTLNKWRVQGKGPRFVKMGRSVSYREADLDYWLDAQTRSSTSECSTP